MLISKKKSRFKIRLTFHIITKCLFFLFKIQLFTIITIITKSLQFIVISSCHLWVLLKIDFSTIFQINSRLNSYLRTNNVFFWEQFTNFNEFLKNFNEKIGRFANFYQMCVAFMRTKNLIKKLIVVLWVVLKISCPKLFVYPANHCLILIF